MGGKVGKIHASMRSESKSTTLRRGCALQLLVSFRTKKKLTGPAAKAQTPAAKKIVPPRQPSSRPRGPARKKSGAKVKVHGRAEPPNEPLCRNPYWKPNHTAG